MESLGNTPPTLSREQQAAILAQLELISRSSSFRKSKRYPAMLEYCVLHTIRGDEEKLRERQLGVKLFSRPLSYDTSADPIVRMAASEIRKRLAQFYDVEGKDARVKISLPPGSYVADFRFLDIATPAPDVDALVTADRQAFIAQRDVIPELHSSGDPGVMAVHIAPIEVARGRLMRPVAWLLAIVLPLIGCLIGYRLWNRNEVPGFWRGALEGASDHVVLVVGQLQSREPAHLTDPDPPLETDIFQANRFVSLGGAASAVALCSTIARANLSCQLKPAPSVDLSSVQKSPAIFVGAYSNPWTLRVSAPLPYRFGPLSCKCILDAKSGESVGEVDFSIPRDKISTDYSIVARFHSEITDGTAVVIAGIGPMSTEAASKFMSSAKGSDELLGLAPKDWKGGNIEAVLATDIVNGTPGHTRILRTAFW
jgi:hypothetical protein